MRVRRLSGLSLAVALSVASLGADGLAPLADAVQRRDKPAMLSLLKKQADVNAPQGDGATALQWAVYLGDADTTAMLIRAGACVGAQPEADRVVPGPHAGLYRPG